jgi:Protein of unknwon function (DUF3310)
MFQCVKCGYKLGLDLQTCLSCGANDNPFERIREGKLMSGQMRDFHCNNCKRNFELFLRPKHCPECISKDFIELDSRANIENNIEDIMLAISPIKNKYNDPVNHPKHYAAHPSGVECITITEGFNFCLGNAIKYIWRAGLKSNNKMEDLNKAKWYIDREIENINKKD